MLHMLLHLLSHRLGIFNSLPCPSSLSRNMILNPFLILFIAKDVSFSSFLHCKFLFGSRAAQCPNGLHYFCLQAALACIRLMMSLGRPLCHFAISACWKWRKVLFRSIDYCSLC
jgi:hypothetical protein